MKPEWQTVSHKCKRISRQKSAEMAEQINTANRYESLPHMHCDDDITGNASVADTANKKKKKDSKPLPICIYGVMDYKAMVENLAKAVDEETYFTKTLSNKSKLSSETCRKLMRHIQDEQIIHHVYQIKQD
jgi:ribosomal protein S25